MNIIVALGNPGPAYEFSRHNFGWLVADRIEDKIRIAARSSTQSFRLTEGKYAGNNFLICRPTTYMNRSGIAVDNLLRLRKADPEDLLVIYDDIDLPFESIRLRRGGGDGGHKGIRSIIRELGHGEFLRLRLGIAQEAKPLDTSEYVLSPFSGEETEALDRIIEKAAVAALDLLSTDAKLVMNRVNRRN